MSLPFFLHKVYASGLTVRPTSLVEFLDWDIIPEHKDICLWLSLGWKGITRINALSNICVSVSRTKSTASLNAPLEYQFKASLMGKNLTFWRKNILFFSQQGLPIEMVQLLFWFHFSFSINYINLHFSKVNFFYQSMFLMWHTIYVCVMWHNVDSMTQ